MIPQHLHVITILLLSSFHAVVAYNVRTEIPYSTSANINHAVPYSATSLYVSSFSSFNSSIYAYDMSSKHRADVVKSTSSGGCVPVQRDPPFSESFPIVPLSILYSAVSNSLYLSDRAPSNRVFVVSRADRASLAANPSLNSYAVAAGGPCNFAESSFPESHGGVPSNTSMTTPMFMVRDDATGNVFMSLRNSVAVIYPNGTMNYFFGSDRRRGTYSDTWNMQEQDRRNATTASPVQLTLDPVNRILYVAEQGFKTIRAIDLKNNTAKIILGKFEGTMNWPPPNCYPGPCRAADVDLIYPTALAYYRPRTVNERWLFVGDRTLSQVFKLVLDTNMVYSVGGQSLRNGNVDGPAESSLFRSINSFATGDSTLYIADGNLRVMDLNDRTTPAPPVVSEEVVTGTTTTVIIATVVASNPVGIVQVTRANVLLELLRCQREFGYLDPINHLLQFSIGDDPDFQYFAGAVVGNSILAIGFVLLHAFIAWVISTAWETTFGSATASLRFPSLVAFPLMFVMESTMASSVSLALYADGYYQAIGIIGIIGCVCITVGIAVYFAFVFEGARQDDFELSKRHSGLLARFLRPVGEWITTDNNRRMGMFFNDYLPNRWWFAVVELSMCIATGIAQGIKPTVYEQCLSLIVYTTVLYTLFFAGMMWLQPNTVRFKFVTSVVIAGLQAIACYLLIATVTTNDRQWEAASTSLVLASLYIGLPRSLLELAELVLDVYRLIKEQAVAHRTPGRTIAADNNERPILIRSDSDSSTNSSILMEAVDVVVGDDTLERYSNKNSFAGSFGFPDNRNNNNKSPSGAAVGGEFAHERLREELRSYIKGGVNGGAVRQQHKKVVVEACRSPSPPPPPPPPPLSPPSPPLKAHGKKTVAAVESSDSEDSMDVL